MDQTMTPITHDDLRLNIVQIEADLKHLTQEVGKIAEAITQMADMRAELREVQGSLNAIVGAQHTRLDELKKDVDQLGNKVRGIEDAVHKIEARLAVTNTKLGAGERVWWILLAAGIGFISQFIKVGQ